MLSKNRRKSRLFPRIKKLFLTPIPLYLALLLALNFGVLAAAGEYFVMTRISTGGVSEGLVKKLTAKVIPAEGYQTSLAWGDIGKRLVETGAIDEAQYRQLFNSPTNGQGELDILNGGSSKPIGINENTSQFVVDTLWAFGLTQKSKVLAEGPMKTAGYDLEGFASTAGWTLGKKSAVVLYNSQDLVPLNDFQQELVKRIAESVYRPCCDNPTSFPDCNHGMAALALIEIEVSAGLPEEQIYRDLLAFNSFWFPQTYLEIAVYLNQQGASWENADPKTILGSDYSSASGAANISQQVKDVPGLDSGGGSCGV